MNKELIVKLADECGFYVEGNKIFAENYDHINSNLEKFAQLIVDECCDIIHEDGYATLNQCAYKIEKHFGAVR